MKTLLNLTLAFVAILSSHAAPIAIPLTTPISTVPMVITKPGHYYLVGNIFFNMPTPTSPSTAITVNAPGPVVIDMRGFTISGSTQYDFPADNYFTVDPTGILIQSSNVTVQNGTISGFWNGIVASGSTVAYLTGIDLEGITFYQSDNDGSEFTYVNNSIVRNCQYIRNYAGLYDDGTQTGNSYINDKVVDSNNPQWAFGVEAPYNGKVVYSYTAIPSISK
jgi:hypothetical protein